MATIRASALDDTRVGPCPPESPNMTGENMAEDDQAALSEAVASMNLKSASQPGPPSSPFAQRSRAAKPPILGGVDSGYASINTSQKGSRENSSFGVDLLAGSSILRKRPTLRSYNQEIPEATKARFLDLKELFDEPLCLYLRKKRIEFNSITIRLKVLGSDEASAKPFIVVMCDKSIVKKVQQYFNQPRVKEECRPSDDDLPSLDVIVYGRPLSTCAASQIDVYGREHQLYDLTNTLCGKPIKATLDNDDRFATIGGVIEVIGWDGERRSYAMTVGHLLSGSRLETGNVGSGSKGTAVGSDSDVCSTSGDDSDEEEADVEIEFDDDENSTKPPAGQNSIQDRLKFDELEDLYDALGWSKIGHTVVLPANTADEVENLDWALVEIDHPKGYLPNHFLDSTFHLSTPYQPLRRMGPVMRENPHDGIEHRVYLLSPQKPAWGSVLSGSPSFVLMKPGKRFVETYTVTLGVNCGKFSDLSVACFD